MKAFHPEPSLEQMRILLSEVVALAQMSESLGRVGEMLAALMTRLLENAAAGRISNRIFIFRGR